MSKELNALVDSFSTSWSSGRKDFRTSGDESWKAYALALRDLVASGDSSFAADRLKDPNRQVRAISARALGFLHSPDSVPALSAALSGVGEDLGDKWATVRLLAADSLGMIHTDAATKALETAKPSEDQKDVSLHIDIALDRDTELEQDSVEDLLRLDEGMLAAAKVGALAPKFTLKSGGGDTIDLDDYRNGGAVALYFLYGDG